MQNLPLHPSVGSGFQLFIICAGALTLGLSGDAQLRRQRVKCWKRLFPLRSKRLQI